MTLPTARRVFSLAALLWACVSLMGLDCERPEPDDLGCEGANERCSTDGSDTLNGRCVAGVCVEDP